MKNETCIFILLIFFMGCATGPGTRSWHKQRILEIETAYKEEKIDYSEYMRLKTETDAINANYTSKILSRPQTTIYNDSAF